MSENATTWRAEIPILRPSDASLARLGEWYAAEYERLVRFAYLIARDSAAAEDLVQDAFVRMSRAGSRIEEAGFSAYARRTILNLARSGFRRRALERRIAPSAATVPGHADSVSAGVDLRAALLSLSVADRSCIVLRHYEGLTDREIAEALGIGLAAAKKRTERAVARLRERLIEGRES